MGARGKYETVATVVAAFTKTRGWKQAELARFVGIQPKQLAKVLDELEKGGMPLERTDEPPHVYWDVPKDWFPGGVHFAEAELPFLVHALLSLPSSSRREDLLKRLLQGRTAAFGSGAQLIEATVDAIPLQDEEHTAALRAEEAISKERALEARYYSSTTGDFSDRVLSPYRIVPSPRPRLVAFCHRDRKLKWFRLDGLDRISVGNQAREPVAADTLSAFLNASVDGYHDGTEQEYAFRVTAPDSRWVKRNLPSGMRVDTQFPSSSSIRVIARGGKLVVARFVVGLGAAAQTESAELAQTVRELARASLEALDAAKSHADTEPAGARH